MATRTTSVKISAQIQEYVAGMEKVAQTTREAGTAGEKLAQQKQAFQQLGMGLTVVGGAMTALTLSVMKTGIEYNSLQQTSRAALSTLLGGAEAANAQMDKLDDFARNSPFSKATFITAQQQMLAFGIEAKNVIPYLDAIQNAVAAAGGSNADIEGLVAIFSKIQSSAKITATDLMQFGNRGVDAASVIGTAMGKTAGEIRSEITDGTLDAGAALDALAEGMQTKFGGAAANVKETFAGAMDRMQAAWRDLSADLATPLVDPSGGGALVDFLNWTADIMRGLQALPEPIKLTGGAMFALAGVIALASGAALLATPRIVAMRVAFMALSGTMRGIAVAGGVAVLALTAIAAVVAAVAASQAEAAAKAQTYANTLEEGTNRVTKATRDAVKEQLALDRSMLFMNYGSAYDNAEKLGISYELVTDAAMGNVDALKELDAQLKAGEDGSQGYADAAYEVTDAVKGEAASVEEAIRMAEQKQKADAETASTSNTAAEAYRDEADAAAGLVDELTSLVDTINEANGVARDAVTANASYQAALEGLTDLVERNGASLDQNTASGSANASALAELATKADVAAKAQFEQDLATMSADDAAVKYNATLAAQKQAFIDSAVQAGFNKGEVAKLANEIYKMPSKKDIDMIVETAAAQGKIDRFVSYNNGRRLVITADVNYQQSGGFTVTPNAAGGVYQNKIKSFAAGGTEPGIYPYQSGGIHRFAEEYDEAYISMDPARRNRSYGVWQQVGQQFGFSQQQASQSAAPPQFDVVVSAKGGIDLLQYVDVRVEQRGYSVKRGVQNRKWSDA